MLVTCKKNLILTELFRFRFSLHLLEIHNFRKVYIALIQCVHVTYILKIHLKLKFSLKILI